MSEVSQTPAPFKLNTTQQTFITTVVICMIVGVAIYPFAKGILYLASHAHPHVLDLARFQRLSPQIKLHLLAALTAVVLGSGQMVIRKGQTFHRIAGWTWVGLVSVVAVSSIFITTLNPGHWSLLHLFTGWTLIVLPLGMFAARRRNLARHRKTMMGLFCGGFVINGFIAMIPGRTVWHLFFG